MIRVAQQVDFFLLRIQLFFPLFSFHFPLVEWIFHFLFKLKVYRLLNECNKSVHKNKPGKFIVSLSFCLHSLSLSSIAKALVL